MLRYLKQIASQARLGKILPVLENVMRLIPRMLDLMTRTPREIYLVQVAIDVAAAALGVSVAIAVGNLTSAPAFKLLNIAGLTFDLIGICLVTIVVLLPPRIREPMIAWAGVGAVSLTGFLLLGFYMGLAISTKLLGGNDHGLFGHFAPVVLFGLISAFLLEDTVMIPKLKHLMSPEARVRFLGGYFIVAGLLIQLYAAFYDLWT